MTNKYDFTNKELKELEKIEDDLIMRYAINKIIKKAYLMGREARTG